MALLGGYSPAAAAGAPPPASISGLILVGALGVGLKLGTSHPSAQGSHSGLPGRQERRHRRPSWHCPVPSGRLEPVLPRRPRQETAERAILRHLAEQSTDRFLRHEQLQRGRSPGHQRRAVGRCSLHDGRRAHVEEPLAPWLPAEGFDGARAARAASRVRDSCRPGCPACARHWPFHFHCFQPRWRRRSADGPLVRTHD